MKRIQAPASPGPRRPIAGVRATWVFRALAGVSARRIRGLSLLASLLLVLVVSPLAALSALPWWSVPTAIAVLAVDFTMLRHAAVAERSARRTKSSAHRANAAVRRTAAPARLAARPATQTAALPIDQPVVVAPVTGGAEVAEPGGSPAVADLSSWAPVPVPPPTYTLKAKAERPVPAPAAVVELAPATPSSFNGLVDDDELDGLLDRRAAGA